MSYRSDSITRTSSALMALIGIFIAVSIPVGYYITVYQYTGGAVNAEIAYSAHNIEVLISNNPHSWHFEEIRLQEILERRLDYENREKRVIKDMQGQIIAQTSETLQNPVLTFSHPIYDSGTQVALIETSLSISPLIVKTAIISACSVVLGILIFLLFRSFPLHAIREAYQTLEENEQRLTLALQSGHFGVSDWDIKKNVMIWNDRMYEIYGVSRNSFKLSIETWQKCIVLEDLDRIMGERDYNTEFRIVRPDGAVRHIKADGIAISDSDGKPTRIISLNQDITDRKRAEEERERLILELRQALSEIKTLSGMLPICTSCKKIRDDKGYWNQIESYIKRHSAAEFSHSICPECAKILYPEHYKQMYPEYEFDT